MFLVDLKMLLAWFYPRVIPYQINKKTRPSWIFMKFGTDMDSTERLSYRNIWLILLISL